MNGRPTEVKLMAGLIANQELNIFYFTHASHLNVREAIAVA